MNNNPTSEKLKLKRRTEANSPHMPESVRDAFNMFPEQPLSYSYKNPWEKSSIPPWFIGILDYMIHGSNKDRHPVTREQLDLE